MGPVLLLASNAGSFITGSVLVVDGGALARTMEALPNDAFSRTMMRLRRPPVRLGFTGTGLPWKS